MAEKYQLHLAAARVAYLMEQEFSGGDLYLILGWFPDRQPISRRGGTESFKAQFLVKLRARRRLMGVPRRYLYSCRWKSQDSPAEIHLVLNRGPESREFLASLWPCGPVLVGQLSQQGPRPALGARLYLEGQAGRKRMQEAVSHSQGLAVPLSDRVLLDYLQEKGLGELLAQGAPR